MQKEYTKNLLRIESQKGQKLIIYESENRF